MSVVEEWLLFVLLLALLVIGFLALVQLLRATSLLRQLLDQLIEARKENRTLLRNVMSVIQESARGLATDITEELGDQPKDYVEPLEEYGKSEHD